MEPREVPAALVPILSLQSMRQAWDDLTPRDREQYASWIGNARSERSARRRATLIADRLRDGLGWASPVRRVMHQYLTIPRGATAADASGAEIGGGPFGHGPGD